MNRTARRVLAGVVVVFAVMAVALAALRPEASSADQAAREISQSLRCPTCAGESIADSSALLSEAMRQAVRDQVDEGRSPDQIRGWFAERYGDEVLLEPPARGYGWLVWTLPLMLMGLTVVALAWQRRGTRRWAAPVAAALTVSAVAGAWVMTSEGHPGAGKRPDAVGERDPESAKGHGTVSVLAGAVEAAPGDAQRRRALASALEEEGRDAEAAEQYAAAVRLEPLDPDLRYRHAFSLVRTGEPDLAQKVLEGTLHIEQHAPTLLLLGALLKESDPDRSHELLERFVANEPDHPSADAIRSQLGADESGERRR